MTTDTKAVARFFWSEDEMDEDRSGDYVLFTDHERVVAELRAELDAMNEAQAAGDGTISGSLLHWHQRALAAESALAASRAEVEGLRKMLPEVRICVEYAIDYGSPSRRADRKELLNTIDAAMEKGNV